MVDALLDTSIIIDLLRGYSDTSDWLESRGETFGITTYVWLEVIEGAPNKRKQNQAIQLLKDFTVIETTYEDNLWAIESLLRVGLSHNVDALDCLIAAPCARLQIPIYTRNMKHFRPLLGELALRPY